MRLYRTAKTVGLERHTCCPSCESEIALKRLRRRTFLCPECQAEFRHNFRRWMVAIPVMLAVTVGLYLLVPQLGLWIIGIGVLLSWVFARNAPEYRVVRAGRPIQPRRRTEQ